MSESSVEPFHKESFLLSSIPRFDKGSVPKNVAIIMDGNRRWAKSYGLQLPSGHIKGASQLDDIVHTAKYIGVKTLTVYAFSTENWKRSTFEVKMMIKLIHSYLRSKKNKMVKEGVKLSVIGDCRRFPSSTQKIIKDVENATLACSEIELIVALNYGGRNEITRAVQKIVHDASSQVIEENCITEDLISQYLDTKPENDPDLIIRTGGESRLSNFLIWQSSYSETYVTPVLWPEFGGVDFIDAITEFQSRKRRYGK